MTYELQSKQDDGSSDEVEEVREEKKKWTRSWTVRMVTGQLKKNEVEKLVGETAGSGPYLRNYPAALSKVVSQLSEEEKANYALLAREWNKAGPPRHIQIK